MNRALTITAVALVGLLALVAASALLGAQIADGQGWQAVRTGLLVGAALAAVVVRVGLWCRAAVARCVDARADRELDEFPATAAWQSDVDSGPSRLATVKEMIALHEERGGR